MLNGGEVVKGDYWNEPVKIEKVDIIGDHVRIVGSTLYTKRHIDQLLRKRDIEKLQIVNQMIDFSSSAQDVFLFVEAIRFKYASLFDPFLAMNVSKIDPLPFQIEAVYGYALKQPRIRFLIADDPGAGKTVMAGLIIKELKLRKLASRILIVVPGHLKDQWRRELSDKFNEKFIVLDRHTFDSHYGENPWEVNDQVISSLDFAKQDDILPSLSSVHWDLVVVDEAHKMAAYSYGENKTEKTQRYKLGEILSKTSNHLLFLTATPHKGDPDNFRLFLDLLYPGFFATSELVEKSLENKDNPLFIRRLKEDLRDFQGRPIFTRRFTQTIKFRLSEKEKMLYNAVSRYVVEQYNKSLANTKKRNVAFALLILQRRMASSNYALLQSLRRRKSRLEEILKGGKEREKEPSIDYETLEDLEELEEQDRWKKEEEWETLTFAQSAEELKEEIKTIDGLIDMVKEIINEESEVKLLELKKAIEEGFKKIREMNGEPKILIFTESKDTLDYLVSKIRSWGYKVNFIHGSMQLQDRIEAEKIFKNETEVMVATEAAGEGINLQFCHLMINYDIPWNPTRLEQRMGRIHRYGQTRDVYIFNLVAEDTKEGEILTKLLEKLEEIKNKLGSDKVFDVVGHIYSDREFYQLIVDAVTQAKTMDEILSQIDIRVDQEYISKIKQVLGESLATKFIDYSKIKEMFEKAEECRLIPEYLERFFKKAFERSGGKFRETKDGFIAVESIPAEIKMIANDVDFKNRFGPLVSSYKKITFDKEKASKSSDSEFVSFGHPLFEALIEWVMENFVENVKKGAVFTDPSGTYDGFIWFYIGEIRDGKGEIAGRKIIAVYDNGKEKREIDPSVLWDLAPSEEPAESMEIKDSDLLPFVIEAVEKYKEEIRKERERQAKIKEKYGVQSLEYLILELDADLAELYEREERGEKVKPAIDRKKEQKSRYEKAKEDLEKEIKEEQSLTISTPELLTVVRVIPQVGEMAENEEIEKIGMQIAMEYERDQGRVPEDVSRENLGFDIRSRGKEEIRYIEVKARAKDGEIILTPNEWIKARMLREKYWLYVVTNAENNPELYIINNPAENLKAIEKVEVVRYIINPEEWKRKRMEVLKWKKDL
ncbi:helicase-related protein [Pseudothermotoga thermarum]|uniref:Helicase domain protein n=1 Tax=Pseudothermotoga thermarum DSM 5069 TaxID=688269 RepID=F7YUJ4_9THEM|nr:helicase-related protein [Pseudothermotoga thermarum]AEH51465.1 helicase domain protein [Pseudothermotoga thermarum DSM 5069]